MMEFLTVDAVLACEHAGLVALNPPTQTWVTVRGRSVLVEPDPEHCKVRACPNANPPAGIRPCLTTLAVTEGYSTFITVDGRRVCLDTVSGLTDGTPPGQVNYTVRQPGQAHVRERP
ncbi:MAG TPA: hypothetical protein VFD39_14110 [Trueperaceae bacterium]|nr:hypothetical protein [Trueperaceae bacterium]